MLRADVAEKKVGNCLIEVIAAQMGVAVGGEHFEDAVLELEDGNVERAAAQVVNGDRALGFLLQPVRQRSGGWFIDDAQDFEPGDHAGVFGRLPLAVVEICGDGNDGLGDAFPEKGFRPELELFQDHGGDLRR